MEDKLKRAYDSIKSYHIREALRESAWKKDAPIEQREALVNAVLDHQLNSLGAEVSFEDGTPKVKRKDLDVDILDGNNQRVDFNSLVKETINKLGAPDPVHPQQEKQQDLLELRRQQNLAKLPERVLRQMEQINKELGIKP